MLDSPPVHDSRLASPAGIYPLHEGWIEAIQPDAPNQAHTLQQSVARHLGIVWGRGPRTSDWAVPDLVPEQIEYAANDVLDLPALLTS